MRNVLLPFHEFMSIMLTVLRRPYIDQGLKSIFLSTLNLEYMSTLLSILFILSVDTHISSKKKSQKNLKVPPKNQK
jgi:hypothetical protein